MRTTFFFIILLFAFGKAFSQLHTIFQSPSVYKQNNVRSRARIPEGGSLKSVVIDYFDQEGLVKETIFYDTSGTKYLTRSVFEYDNTQQLVGQTNYEYSYFDTIKKQGVTKLIPDTLPVQFYFDSLHRVIKKIFTDRHHRITQQNEFTYHPFAQVHTSFGGDIIRNVNSWHYDAHDMEKDETNMIYLLDGKSKTSVFKFKNVYDKAGNLKKRKVSLVSDPAISYVIFFENEENKYLQNGLLIQRSLYNIDSEGERHGSTLMFDYKFW